MPQSRATSRSVKDELANFARLDLKGVIRSETALSCFLLRNLGRTGNISFKSES
jgi:hypothetical protein